MDKFDIFTLVLIISYFVLIIFIERIYYQILFDESLEIIPDFQKSGKSLHYFWKFMTFFGTKGGIGPIYVVLFLFIPLNKVYTLTFLLLFTGFVDHTSKMVYRQERPLWMNDEIDIGNNHACGYGNPSGHSLSSSCIYLSLWYVLCDIIDEKISDKLKAKVIKVITLILSILIFLTIMTSRLYLGVHSLNQIIFGCTLGIGIFFLFLPILKVYYTPKTFFQKQYSNKYTHLIITIMFIISFYLLYFLRNDIPGITEKNNWKKMCLDQKWSKLLMKGSFMGGMSIFIILGMIIGLSITKNKIEQESPLEKEIILRWEKGHFSTRLIRLLFLLIGFCPVGIIFLLNSFFNFSYILYYIITPVLFFVGGFLSFGPCLYHGFKYTLNKFGMEKLYNKDKIQNIELIGS